MDQINHLSPMLFTESQQERRNQVKSIVRSLQKCFTTKCSMIQRLDQTKLSRVNSLQHDVVKALNLKADQSETRA